MTRCTALFPLLRCLAPVLLVLATGLPARAAVVIDFDSRLTGPKLDIAAPLVSLRLEQAGSDVLASLRTDFSGFGDQAHPDTGLRKLSLSYQGDALAREDFVDFAGHQHVGHINTAAKGADYGYRFNVTMMFKAAKPQRFKSDGGLTWRILNANVTGFLNGVSGRDDPLVAMVNLIGVQGDRSMKVGSADYLVDQGIAGLFAASGRGEAEVPVPGALLLLAPAALWLARRRCR